MNKIFIILPVYNRVETTKKFVTALKKQSHQNFHLILVDDGCTDGTAEMVKSEIENVTILTGQGDLWWGGSLHRAYLHLKEIGVANNEYVMIINDDTVFNESFLETGLSYITQNPKTLLQATAYCDKSNILIDKGTRINWPLMKFNEAEKVDEINCLSTRGLILLGDDFLDIGGFIPEVLPHYCSDYEFTIRARKLNYKLKVSDGFSLKVDNDNTGLHSIDSYSIKDYIDKIFSMRSAKNPMTMSKFILKSAPLWAMPFALTRIWIGFCARFFLMLGKKRC
jgi:GT2 family glycosyltransferase